MSRPTPAPAGPRRRVCIRPWKGPLPRPRITPPVALAAFMPTSAAGPSSSVAPGQSEETAAQSTVGVDPEETQKTLTSGSRLQAPGPDVGIAKQTLRLGLTLRRADLFRYRRSICPSTSSGNLGSSSHEPPPSSYAQALRRKPSPSMAGRNGLPSKGATPAPPFGLNPSAANGFGAAAGPLRFGAPPVSAQQGTAPPPGRFGANSQPKTEAPAGRRQKYKRKGGGVRRDTARAAAVPPDCAPFVGLSAGTDVVSSACSSTSNSRSSCNDGSSVDTTAQPPRGKKTGLWCFKCRTNEHLSKECTVVHYYHICNSDKHHMHRCTVLKQPRPSAMLDGCGLVNAMFLQLPDSLSKEHLAPPTLPAALVTISGGTLSTSVVEADWPRSPR